MPEEHIPIPELGAISILNVLTPVAKSAIPHVSWEMQCMEAYEAAGGAIPGMPPLETLVGVLKGAQERQTDMFEAFIAEVQRDITKTVDRRIVLNKKKALYPDIVSHEDVGSFTSLANQAEEKVLTDITTVFDPQVVQIAGLILRAEKLLQNSSTQ